MSLGEAASPPFVSSAPDWRPIFGHDDPYDDQRDGIETAIETAADDGFLALEGACGTGKTMLALTAGIHLVRDPDSSFERVFVLTSVKQQLRQFEADIRTINGNLPDDWHPVSALTLVGKADVCPYNLAGAGGIDDTNVYERCEGLRERTRGLTDEATTAGSLAQQARSQQVGLGDSAGEASYLEAAGEPTPYPPEMPAAGDADVEFCPFYAGFLDDLPEDGDPIEAVPFDPTDRGLIETDDLVELSASRGSCPHSVMGALLPNVEILVGNYYHAFDPTTVEAFTGGLIDEETFVICDEAHMLEPRVRDLVGDSVSDRALADAAGELSRVIETVAAVEEAGQSAEHGPEARARAETVRQELNGTDVTLGELRDTRRLLGALGDRLDERVTASLDRRDPGWRQHLPDLDDDELPLRDPETPETDELTRWAEENGFDERLWVRAEAVCAAAATVLNTLDEDDKRRAAPAVGRTLARWRRCDHTDYFRAIDLERTWDDTRPAESWRRAYTASYTLHNCLPADEIGERLAAFGGGVLMSATLEPLDVFAEVTGLRHLEREADRPVVERTYGLEFPEANRASFAVDAPKFTYENRGDPGDETPTRQAHARAIRQVAAAPGNVLVCLPSYREAEWAASVLSALDKEVLVDEATDDVATERLKQSFFEGEPKVLVTSLRGTLTEGVDYRGDRLSAAIVCGVPIINTASPQTRAVRTAYDRAFGDGFKYALSVPAVRKARQAVGRVIRGPDECGVRVLCDERYARESWDSVRDLLGEAEREEFQPVGSDMLDFALEQFWDDAA
ncbi:DNA repair helicase Rad3 [Natronomonas pharaonis DSM 2160]|uniref:DNA repair helicase Rad3 n=1 Tax=Natronomonas pharaonis (strain ATCC 35678 / DSM 2160 / CIP 103997 / JCM 8858 / NBRC 14720 / NCIMB 2260 / Gabara) TaxID=348780 RepID=A0A1U7EUE5_NATPD|nr:DNA repair helicase Rad3 [Natronomonas pharaonis DSM 2160]